MSKSYTYIVVGGGIAGVSCVEQILECQPSAHVLLISASPVVKEASEVTRLTKTLEDFVVVEKSFKSFKDVHPSVSVLHDTVATLNHEEHTVVTNSGKTFSYSKLCICTGARPKILFPHSPYVLGIRDTESVSQLAARISGARKVLLLGNGGIATEFVHEVEGLDILWAVKDTSISAHFLDPGAAEFFLQATSSQQETPLPSPTLSKRRKYTLSTLQGDTGSPSAQTAPTGSALGPDWHQNAHLLGLESKKNVQILYSTECLQLSAPPGPSDFKVMAHLSNGETVLVDLVISATGVIPNSAWAPCAQDEERGIFVNSLMATNVPDVYAAGDVCYPTWPRNKHWFQMKLWTQARQMGLYAGKSMVTSTTPTEEELELDFCFEIFSHVTRFFGFKVVLLGLFNAQGLLGEDLTYLLRCTKGLEYIKVVLEKGTMQGAILIGDTGLEETFENLILNQINLSGYGEELLDPDIDLEDYFD